MKIIVPPEKLERLKRSSNYAGFVRSEKKVAALTSPPSDKLILAKKPEEDKDRIWHIDKDNQVLKVQVKKGETVFAEGGCTLYMAGEVTPRVEKPPVKWASPRQKIIDLLFEPFITYYEGEGEVAFAGYIPGELVALQIEPGASIFAHQAAWFAGIGNFDISIEHKKLTAEAVFGVEGLLLRKFKNQDPKNDGFVFFYSCGGYEPLELENEKVIVEVDSVLAWEESVDYTLGISKIKSAFLGGEGLFTIHLTGPGMVILQTTNSSKLQSVIEESIVICPPPIMAMNLAFKGVKKGYRYVTRGRY
jgi:uncharacterized protein (AIM24 family)